MLKYLYAKQIFREIPGEITLGISISGCKIRCPECHSQELWEDKGIPLTIEEIERLLEENKGVTCLLLLGGEHDIDYLIHLFKYFHPKIKTAWYCGLDRLPSNTKKIENYLTWLKMGRYIEEKGGLDNPNTNQRLYWILHHGSKNIRYNLTKKLQKK